MKRMIILAIFLVCSNAAFADSDISAVFVKNNEIVVSSEDVGRVQLTHDGIPKGNPLWSKDGTMIAFTKLTPKNVALDSLVVIGRDGRPLYNFLIHPVSPDPNWTESGMRYVERIQWLNNSKIAVSGSINPSTGENIIFDLSKRKISREFYDDGGWPAFSPDGRHVAYITGAPHFTPKSGREPELDVDNGHRVFPPVGTKVDFITDPAWSADSQTLAIVATSLDTKISNIVLWHIADTQPLLIPVPIEEDKHGNLLAKLLWNGDGLFVASGNHEWLFAQGKFSEISPSQAVNPKQDAMKIKKGLETSLGVGPGQSDFWCESCPLSLLPRRSPIYDHNVK